jgi:hypothetical protein
MNNGNRLVTLGNCLPFQTWGSNKLHFPLEPKLQMTYILYVMMSSFPTLVFGISPSKLIYSLLIMPQIKVGNKNPFEKENFGKQQILHLIRIF